MKHLTMQELDTSLQKQLESVSKGDKDTIQLGFELANQKRFQDVRWTILCEIARNGRFIKNISLIDNDTDINIRLYLSENKEDPIVFSDNRGNSLLPSTTYRTSALKIFARDGIKAFLATKSSDAIRVKGNNLLHVPLQEIATCYNGRAIPINNNKENGKRLPCISPKFIETNPFINPETKLKSKYFLCPDKGDSPVSMLHNAILIKNFYYTLDNVSLFNNMARVRGPVECVVEKGLHVIELDPFIDERYFDFLFCNIFGTQDIVGQLVCFNKTYNKLTIDDLERILVPEPSALNKGDRGFSLNMHKKLCDRVLEIKRIKPITFEILNRAFIDVASVLK